MRRKTFVYSQSRSCYSNIPILFLTLLLNFSMFTESLLCLSIVAIHRLEPACEYRALLHFLPVMQHIPILDGAGDFITTTGNDFFFIFLDSLLQGYLTIFNPANCFQEMGRVTNTVVKSLTAIWEK